MKTTKNILSAIAVMLTLLLFFQACEKSSNVDYSGKYLIKIGETKNFPQGTKLATLTFQEFTDNRCPINTDCIWYGAAQGKFKLKIDQKEQTLELCLGSCNTMAKPKNQEFSVNGVTYSVNLLALTPYPSSSQASEKQEATLLVQKK